MHQPDGAQHQAFNAILKEQLEKLVFDIKRNDKHKQEKLLAHRPSPARKVLLLLPAAIGYLTHVPMYLPVKNFTLKRTNHNDHYDSVLTGILFLAYPLYVLLATFFVFFLTGSLLAFLLFLVLPFTAWSYVQLKDQLDK
jgi:hypothetical protein